MTTELVILLTFSAFILVGVFFNKENGPRATFEHASPSLGARLERQIETGSGFQKQTLQFSNNLNVTWQKAPKDQGTYVK
jgi:hypothetical protein